MNTKTLRPVNFRGTNKLRKRLSALRSNDLFGVALNEPANLCGAVGSKVVAFVFVNIVFDSKEALPAIKDKDAPVGRGLLLPTFLYLKNVKHYSRNTSTVAICGIKFFFENTLNRHWALFGLVRAPRERNCR